VSEQLCSAPVDSRFCTTCWQCLIWCPVPTVCTYSALLPLLLCLHRVVALFACRGLVRGHLQRAQAAREKAAQEEAAREAMEKRRCALESVAVEVVNCKTGAAACRRCRSISAMVGRSALGVCWPAPAVQGHCPVRRRRDGSIHIFGARVAFRQPHDQRSSMPHLPPGSPPAK
jgi:hypothetical protein